MKYIISVELTTGGLSVTFQPAWKTIPKDIRITEDDIRREVSYGISYI